MHMRQMRDCKPTYVHVTVATAISTGVCEEQCMCDTALRIYASDAFAILLHMSHISTSGRLTERAQGLGQSIACGGGVDSGTHPN